MKQNVFFVLRLILLCFSVSNSMFLLSLTDFAPTLHRLWYGGTTEDHRKIKGGIYREKWWKKDIKKNTPLVSRLVGC